MIYSESEPDPSFVINLVSSSESDSEYDSSLAFINLDTCVFFKFVFTLF